LEAGVSRVSILRIKERFVFKQGILKFLVKYFFFQLQVINALKGKDFEIINCHNLSVLGIGVYFKILKKTRLIYDAHELETEVDGARGIKKRIGKWLETLYMPFVDELIVVSNLIGEWYKNRYKLRHVTVVCNVPHFYPFEGKSDLIRELFSIAEEDLVFIYQGVLSRSRGVHLIKDAFLSVSENRHIVFMGMGELAEEIKMIAEHRSNFHFIPAVPPSEIKKYTSSADVGIHLIQNTCLNHYYCSPNKVFEYLMYGIPQIISDFPEMANTIEKGACGWVITPDKEHLMGIIQGLTRNEVKEKTERVREKRKSMGWEKEEFGLMNVYSRVTEQLK
jgi:glycosyltransferase involved in cell wall biosynthesis